MRRAGHQHVEIGHRAAQHLVEQVVRRLDGGGLVRGCALIAVNGAQPLQKRNGLRQLRHPAADGETESCRLLGRKLATVGGRGRRDLARRRVEAQRSLPQLCIEALIAQDDGLRPHRAATADAAAVPPQPANLEQIGEVAVEQHGEAQIDRTIAVVMDRQPLIGRVAPEKNRPHDVQGVLRQNEVIVEVHIGIGQIHGQQGVVVAHVRAQQQGLHAVERGARDARGSACRNERGRRPRRRRRRYRRGCRARRKCRRA